MKDGNYSGAVANIPLNYVFQGITVAYLPTTVQFFATYVHPTTGGVKQNSPAKQYNSLGVTLTEDS